MRTKTREENPATNAPRAALVFFRGVPAAMTGAHAIPSLSYLCFYNGVMQKLWLSHVGSPGLPTDEGSCFNPPRCYGHWAFCTKMCLSCSCRINQVVSGQHVVNFPRHQALAKSIHLLRLIMKAHVFGITPVHSFSLGPTKHIKMT